MQTFQTNIFISVMLIGTIDFHHFIPHSVVLTLALGHKVKVSVMKNQLASFSHTFFI